MPNIKSAMKRVRSSKKRAMRNKSIKSVIKTQISKFEKAVENGDTESANELFKVAVKKIDQSVEKGILHKNTGARKKSQLARKLKNISA